MLSILLNITGIVLIIISIYVIKKDLSKYDVLLRDLNLIEDQVREYHSLTEKSIEDFHDIIESKLDILEGENQHNDNIINENRISNNSIIKDEIDKFEPLNLDPTNKKIIELSSIGLTNEEIAKRLKKGKREIEIILKLYKDKKTNKTL